MTQTDHMRVRSVYLRSSDDVARWRVVAELPKGGPNPEIIRLATIEGRGGQYTVSLMPDANLYGTDDQDILDAGLEAVLRYWFPTGRVFMAKEDAELAIRSAIFREGWHGLGIACRMMTGCKQAMEYYQRVACVAAALYEGKHGMNGLGSRQEGRVGLS